MREILFRGKRLDNGEWVEGYLYITHNGEHEISIYNDEVNIERWTHEVDPSTVGQYTGLTDKNGNRIWEGDILRSCYDNLYPYDESIEVVKWFLNGWHIQQGEYPPDAMDGDGVMPYSEVIGNIHDNPELLEK